MNKVKDIPSDYKGKMGVPINFMIKHCSSQFKVVDTIRPILKGKAIYQRVIIERI